MRKVNINILIKGYIKQLKEEDKYKLSTVKVLGPSQN